METRRRVPARSASLQAYLALAAPPANAFGPPPPLIPARAELGHAAERGEGGAADQQRQVHGRRPDRPCVAAGLLLPDRPHLGELGVEATTETAAPAVG